MGIIGQVIIVVLIRRHIPCRFRSALLDTHWWLAKGNFRHVYQPDEYLELDLIQPCTGLLQQGIRHSCL